MGGLDGWGTGVVRGKASEGKGKVKGFRGVRGAGGRGQGEQ